MKPNSSLRSATVLLLFIIVILGFAPAALASGKEKVLYSFQGIPDGEAPVGGIVFDSAGNLYGAAGGGANTCLGIGQCGVVYQLKPPVKQGDPWTESVLYTFLGKTFNDAETPNGGVVIDQAGNLYGTTGYGGTGSCILLGTDVGCGVVYELSPPAQERELPGRKRSSTASVAGATAMCPLAIWCLIRQGICTGRRCSGEDSVPATRFTCTAGRSLS